MKIKMMSPTDITPYEGNPRTIEQAAVDKVAASINEFGWQQPIVVDGDHVIIVGHTRRQAALKLHVDCPVLVTTDLTPEQVAAYRLADNRTGEETTWDEIKLSFELSSLKSSDFDISLIGFNEAELARYLGDLVDDSVGEWSDGVPDYEQGDGRPFRSLIIHFADQAAVDQFKNLLTFDFSVTAKYAHYPEIVVDRVADLRYAADKEQPDA